MTRQEHIEDLAVAFIEFTTEWDFEQLPDDVKFKVREAARALLDWERPEPTFPSLPTTPTKES